MGEGLVWLHVAASHRDQLHQYWHNIATIRSILNTVDLVSTAVYYIQDAAENVRINAIF